MSSERRIHLPATGPAIAASRPIMTMTTRSSMNMKPRSVGTALVLTLNFPNCLTPRSVLRAKLTIATRRDRTCCPYLSDFRARLLVKISIYGRDTWLDPMTSDGKKVEKFVTFSNAQGPSTVPLVLALAAIRGPPVRQTTYPSPEEGRGGFRPDPPKPPLLPPRESPDGSAPPPATPMTTTPARDR